MKFEDWLVIGSRYTAMAVSKQLITKPAADTNKDQPKRIILGIDPGSIVMGYGIIICEGRHNRLVEMDVLQSGRNTETLERLKMIFKKTSELISHHQISEMAIEDPFYGKNVQSMLKLGRAQGMAIAAAMHHDIPVHQYAARKIKQSITGKGNSSKEQVAAMLQRLLNIGELPKFLDATDAVAVALCHINQNPAFAGGNKFNSWKAFISQNPDRVK